MAETVNGYKVVTPWTTAGGGMGQWAFAEKGGKQYFIKQFLRPTYPVPEGPGSPDTKARKLAACERFEKHHRDLLKDLQGIAGSGGHLVVTREFFRVAAKYYKITDRVEESSLSVGDISRIDPEKGKVILSLSLSHSLAILHRQGIVHGDIKPANILPKAASKDVIVAKLIDFDDSYRVEKPPPPNEIVGDFTYYSPELVQYIHEEVDGTALGSASDVFALGIVLCQYFTGELPKIVAPKRKIEAAGTVALAALQSQGIVTHLEETWPDIDDLIRSMLQLNRTDRPSVAQVSTRLIAIRDLESKGSRRVPEHVAKRTKSKPGTSEPIESTAALRGKGLLIGKGEMTSPSAPASSPATSALRGKLAALKKDK